MSERKATDKQRSWCGDHVPNPAQYRYGMIPGTERPEIESTVELSEKEVETIRTRIRDLGARFAIVRPTPRDPGHLDVEFRSARPFERIRRITGYLVGTLDRWNSAKQAEERDRVKHGIPNPEEEVNLHIKED